MNEPHTDQPTHLTDIPEPTPDQIRAVRYYFNWVQEEAAPKFDIGYTTLVDLERGARTPTSVTRAKIGLAMLKLGINFDNAGNVLLPRARPTA